MKKYIEEKNFILKEMQNACDFYISKNNIQKQSKGYFDIVTETDLTIEQYIINQIKSKYPEDHILSEEFNYIQSIEGRTWTVDPIDGTFNYANSIPLYGIQCSLIECDQIVVSVIILPELNETYYAVVGEGAFLNGKRINVNAEVKLEQALVSVGDYQHNKPAQAELQHLFIGDLYKHVARIRMFGAASIDFGFVSSGKTSGTVILTNNIWDIAPGLLIAQEAGAIVTNLYGKKYQFSDFGVVVTANNVLNYTITKIFTEVMKKNNR